MNDIEFLEAKIRSLQNECRELKETLRDRYAMSVLPALVTMHKPGAVKEAFRLADEAIEARKQ